MSESFSETTTAQEVADAFAAQIKDRVFIVTGANIGLGLETCRALASQGANVVMAARSPEKGQDAVKKIKEEIPMATVNFMQLDLGDLASVGVFTKQFADKYDRLDCLINNAGIMAAPFGKTKDGFEEQFGVNHLGHFQLTRLLMPILMKTGTKKMPARVVSLSSNTHWLLAPLEGILFDDLSAEKSYNMWTRYGHSKLANVLFAYELNKRYSSKNVIGVSAHPGVISSTNLNKHLGMFGMGVFLYRIYATRGFSGFSSSAVKFKSIPAGSSTTLVAALDPNVKAGAYYDDCQVGSGQYVHELAYDDEQAKRLWEVSEQMIDGQLK